MANPSYPSKDPAEVFLEEHDPDYAASREAWKHVEGESYGSPFEEIPRGGSAELEIAEMAAAGPEGYDPDREVGADIRKRDSDRMHDQKPHRTKDRHKGSRAPYFRAYRAKKKSEAAGSATTDM